MVGFGRTGKLFGFQHYDGVVPDILTAAKGLSSAALPISMMAVRKHIQEAFDDKPLGWGSTYAAHPVAVACAYENVKHLIKADVIGHVQRLAPKFEDSMKTIAENHPCVKQYRSIGMFGCFDVHTPEGKNPQLQHTAIDSAFVKYKKVRVLNLYLSFSWHSSFRVSHKIPWELYFCVQKAYTENGLIGLLRPPHLHVAPPLIISEDELMDGFERQDRALYALDDALGY
jgi:adenosylmethionine-8-amino-7-oxononanoate aminotransferase